MNNIQGTYIIRQENSNIYLKNNNIFKIIDYFLFKNILMHTFLDKDRVDKILYKLNCEEKLLIDFDKKIVKIIQDKDLPFSKYMQSFMSIDNVIAYKEGEEINIEDYYKKGTNL